jgi:lysophospholipase L1-like esterase
MFLTASLTVAAVAATPHPASVWIGSWATSSVALANTQAVPLLLSGKDHVTIREYVHLSLGGHRARVVFTNEFGLDPLVIGHATLASGTGSKSVPITFAGRTAVVIAPGAISVSDPIVLSFAPLDDVEVTLTLPPQPLRQLTIHTAASQPNFLESGNAVDEQALASSQRTTSWYFLKSVEVEASQAAGAIVVFGDSISDGAHSTPGANHRWPDDLARRLQGNISAKNLAVLNAGIGGNRVLHEGNGPAALSRFDRDVLAQPAVRQLIVLEGINDIAHATDPAKPYDPITSDDLIEAYMQLIIRAHGHGISVIFGTITPYDGNRYFSSIGEEIRQIVNRWIKTNRIADGFIDFDRAVRDPNHPTTLLAAYDSGDHLHPNDLGYQAMANVVDLASLSAHSIRHNDHSKACK